MTNNFITRIHIADPHHKQNDQSIREKQIVDSWNTKKILGKKDILYLHDDNVGEDSLSSQLTYVHDIIKVDYRQRHQPQDAFLRRPSQTEYPHLDLRPVYKSLSRVVFDLRFKHVNQITRRYIDDNRSIIDSKIAEIRASSVVFRPDDIEFCDWADSKQSHCLWYCSNVSESSMLCTAIKKALRKTPNYSKIDPDYVSPLNIDAYQFLGFVSRTLKQSYPSCFHLVSFVLFRTNLQSEQTVVVSTLTHRNHIQSNMMDRLLQIVQLYQYQDKKIPF